MSDAEDIVARLRCITWMGSDSLCHAAADEIERLREHLTSVKFLRCREVGKLRDERDEARRSCCEYAAIVDGADTADGMESGRFYEIAMKYMKDRGWDCFKENTDGR